MTIPVNIWGGGGFFLFGCMTSDTQLGRKITTLCLSLVHRALVVRLAPCISHIFQPFLMLRNKG